ncbi:hypothetical protein A2U01_0094619, partial [Trifolium medium]|nr:hypothetical protein [Trifolium medium]
TDATTSGECTSSVEIIC